MHDTRADIEGSSCGYGLCFAFGSASGVPEPFDGMRRLAGDRSEKLTALNDLQIVETQAVPLGWHELLIGRVQRPV
jgi:hypothetical protein